jgi:hypothetical protein
MGYVLALAMGLGACDDEPGADGVGGGEDTTSSGPGVASSSTGTGAGSEGGSTPGTNPVHLAFMVHLEGWDLGDEAQFTVYTSKIRELMSTFEAHGAKLTLEVVAAQEGMKESLVMGVQLHGDDVLGEALARGHWVSLHGAGSLGLEATYDQFVADLVAQRALLGEIGITAHHASNICSAHDWVSALAEAGFSYATGIVGYCAKCLPIEQQPPDIQACDSPNVCHGHFPTELTQRLHPRRVSGPDWLTTDPNGPLVIINGAYNLTCIAEEVANPGSYLGCNIDDEDRRAYLAELPIAIDAASGGEITSFSMVWSMGGHPTTMELPVVDQLLADLEPYVASGQARFSTTQEIYETFVEAETP